MRINDVITKLQMDMKTYTFGVYAKEGNVLEDPIKSYKYKDKEVFILESNTPEIEETIFVDATESSKELYEELKELSFYFIVYTTNEYSDDIGVSEEIFFNIDDAIAYAKQLLKQL